MYDGLTPCTAISRRVVKLQITIAGGSLPGALKWKSFCRHGIRNLSERVHKVDLYARDLPIEHNHGSRTLRKLVWGTYEQETIDIPDMTLQG